MNEPSHEAALAAHGFDAFETGLLAVLRQFLLSHETPDSQAWQRAYMVAAERWGEAIGLPAAQALMKLLRAVLDCRDGRFTFIDPFDLELRGTVTPDEAALLQMLHHMRRDQTPGAREAVAEVTGGKMDPHVIRAGLAFAHRFSAGQAAARPEAPRLRVVA
ncbi:hypothetical protein K3553_01915 [Leisingera aquaemixtae]|uniref:hypothetical protein n=1 Tax=Leisingera aquaemixtae TaxID=1396826 RepID=UPI0021A6D758|nr:hypothetical protein [Leisingera aquaemixtae]UWQ25244.1 hypothetical protein K3553_01915 [Leisingera aquaemixtae]